MTARPDQSDHAMVQLPRDRTILGQPSFSNMYRNRFDAGFRMLFRRVAPENTSRQAGIGTLYLPALQQPSGN
jgi:hypothetical protein